MNAQCLQKHSVLLSYCLKRRRNTESKNARVLKTIKGKPVLFDKICSV